MQKLNSAAPDFAAKLQTLVNARREGEDDKRAAVAAIIAAIRQRGDAALCEYTARFDNFTPTPQTLRVPQDEIAAAHAACDPALRHALQTAATRIEAFHRRSLPADIRYIDETGVTLGARWTPIDAAGIYVPGGLAAYPSSLLMNAVPARTAGVRRIAMAVPAPNGVLNPVLLAAAHIAGVTEIYRIGGAQAVAALAHGTATIPPVDKITGPGNAWVAEDLALGFGDPGIAGAAEAKRQVFGTVGIDMIAGPSEILVIADAGNNPDHIAADLLSQAEHDATAQAILLTPDAAFAEKTIASLERQLATLPRNNTAAASWRDWGIVIITRDVAEAAAIANAFAPEHAELCVADPEALLPKLRHAGSIFLGRHTPEAIGDYIAGANHVLPTARTARFASGLNVTDFMKRSTLIGCTPQSLAALGPAAVTLAEAEGLHAHALSITRRLQA